MLARYTKLSWVAETGECPTDAITKLPQDSSFPRRAPLEKIGIVFRKKKDLILLVFEFVPELI